MYPGYFLHVEKIVPGFSRASSPTNSIISSLIIPSTVGGSEYKAERYFFISSPTSNGNVFVFLLLMNFDTTLNA